MTAEYRVDLKVRNNIILYKIEQAGYKNVNEFCRANHLNFVSALGEIINMKKSPLNAEGEFRPLIIRVAELLQCDPLDLFSDTQLHVILQSNKRVIQVNEAEMKFMLTQADNNQKLLEDIIFEEEKNTTIDKTLGTLTPREEDILKMRYALGDYTHEHTLDECATRHNLTRERIRQIEVKALRKLRHSSRADDLKKFLTEKR